MTGVWGFCGELPLMGHLIKPPPSARLSRLDHLFSFDFSAATDRFPLPFQETVVKQELVRSRSLFSLGL